LAAGDVAESLRVKERVPWLASKWTDTFRTAYLILTGKF
jgi:hypothetical protein